MTAKLQHWRKSATAVAVAAVLGVCATQALALSLGRIAVQSALGEPLRAEIDLPSITPEEAASLKAAVAHPDAYRTAGVAYNPIMSDLQIDLLRKNDGRPYLSISSNRSLTDPFVDLILDARWSSGRIVSLYTLLLDPPNLRQAATPAPALAQVPPPLPDAPVPAIQSAAPSTPVEPVSRAAQATSEPSSSRSPPEVHSAPAPVAEVVKPALSSAFIPAREVTLKSGDTASKIAMAYKASDVSLDQMLIALLRANPDVFVNGNLNRVRAGAVMILPDADQALATPAREAGQLVIAHSKDFSEYRAKLAGSVPTREVAAADRRDSGKIEAQIRDKKSSEQAPDKLTLSKGATGSKTNEEQVAKERAADEAASRTQALNKNLEELNKLSSASQTAEPSPPAALAGQPPVPAIPAVAQEGWLDQLIKNPMTPAAAGGLIALLAGFGFYRIRQRKQTSQAESSLAETSLVASSSLEGGVQPPTLTEGDVEQPIEVSDASLTDSALVNPQSMLVQPGDLPESTLDQPMALNVPDSESLDTGIQADSLEPAQPETAHPIDPEPDLDLDFLLDDQIANAPPPLDMNFEGVAPRVGGIASGDAPAPDRTNADQDDLSGTDPSVVIELPDDMGDLEISLDGQDSSPPELDLNRVQDKKPSDMLEFDLSSLSLDLDTPAQPAPTEIMDDPLATKLALAEEFNAIGDVDGARAMIEEVIAEATGDMKVKAQQALSALI